ncbi:UDP-glycosyltransferase 76B1 [Ziziphus jujuba]|uniref:UDP-glycosyltransferase 76B1 n=1 Tax=Ziziphus jujuba TaxID=326968 RepID=A0A6P3Z260_ZIZJJ|nr:UDP-glycosyltransferase 76B1 [Ziziphus jujuba]
MDRKGRKLVLFPLPCQGHINPMLQLANILYSKGFSISIIHTSFNCPNPSNYPHFTFHSIGEGLSESEASIHDGFAFLSLLNTKYVDPFRECLGRMLCDVSEEPVACLISDATFYFTQAVAESLKVPRIVLKTESASSFLVFAALPLLRERGYIPIQDSRLEEPVVEFPHLKVKDLPLVVTSTPEVFYQVIDSVVSETKASSGLIWNTFEELEHSELTRMRNEFPIPIFPIGPFHNASFSNSSSSSLTPEDKSCISWLNTQPHKSVIYVSFGSIADLNEAEFLEVAWGLANSNQPFLWVVRPGLVNGSEWLESLPNGFLENLNGRGNIVKWAPQQEVLAHPAVGAFWTHNGWNSTMESIREGVPMICMPRFGDQLVNARYVSQVWKVGLQLEKGLKRGYIEKTIEKLMVEKEGEEIRFRISKLKEKANLCLKQDASSYKSLESLVSHISSLG